MHILREDRSAAAQMYFLEGRSESAVYRAVFDVTRVLCARESLKGTGAPHSNRMSGAFLQMCLYTFTDLLIIVHAGSH